MLLTEYQSKTILQRHGIETPPGKLVNSAEEAAVLAAELGTWPLVLKAQIPAGGRARGYFESPAAGSGSETVATAGAIEARDTTHGGIRIVNSVEQTESEARSMLGRNLVTPQTGPRGRLVSQLYLETHAQIERELYIALTIDAPNGCIVFLASNQGGTLVEQVSQNNPQAIASIALGAEALQITQSGATVRMPTAAVLQALSLNESHGVAIEKLLNVMLHVFVERDATLVEINPFGFGAAGELIILDAAIQWDDNSLFRQGHEEELVAYDSLSLAEHDARVARLNYHDLDGNIGTLGFGAAVAMATNDALVASGGRAANFLDVAPSAEVERIQAGIDVLLANPQVDAILINAFGGGILRCMSVCDALLQADAGQSLADCGKPVVVRLAGVEDKAAREQLKASLPAVIVCTDLRDAVEEVVSRAATLNAARENEKSRPDKHVGEHSVDPSTDSSTRRYAKPGAMQRLRSLVFGSAEKSGEQTSANNNKSIKTEEVD